METQLALSGKDTMLQHIFLVRSEERPEVRFFCLKRDEVGKTASDLEKSLAEILLLIIRYSQVT